MQIPINYLQERFPVFAYSTLQKYKSDKESNKFFGSKKDFYLFLEANYLLELKARKKLINITNIKDIYFFYILNNLEKYIYEINPIKSLIQDFKKLKQTNFRYFPDVTLEGLIEKKEAKIYDKQEIINNFEKKILTNDINHFDQWVILEIIINIKKYFELLISYSKKNTLDSNDTFFDVNKNNLEIYLKNTDNEKQTFFLEYEKKSNKIIIKEKIVSSKNKNENKRIKSKFLEEPKWVYYSNNSLDLYLDHSFNFIEINYEDKYFQYNLLKIPLNVLFDV